MSASKNDETQEKKEKKAKAAPKAKEGAAEPKAPKAVKGAKAPKAEEAPEAPRGPREKPRLLKLYEEQILPKLREEFRYSSVMAVPRLTKITVNIGVGEAKNDIKLLDEASNTLTVLAGQKAAVRRARKSVSNFKLRQGQPIGAMVTLRGHRMYEFLDRLITLAIPRMRDFRGVPDRSFDGHGNYTLGIKDQLIFPEVDYNKITRAMGMNVTIGTTAKTDPEAKALLMHFGMPFRR
ncbi:MAG: 50S ribosomal protein L5 [Acidobacteriota bacterium]